MTELITDHAYERGPYGRCAAGSPPCNKRKSAHDNGPVPGPVVSPLRASLNSDTVIETPHVSAPVVEPFPPPTSFPPEPPPPPPIDWLSAGLPVYINLRRKFAKAGDEASLNWPVQWPLPRVGESVWYRSEQGHYLSRVKDIQFDTDRNRIILVCE